MVKVAEPLNTTLYVETNHKFLPATLVCVTVDPNQQAQLSLINNSKNTLKFKVGTSVSKYNVIPSDSIQSKLFSCTRTKLTYAILPDTDCRQLVMLLVRTDSERYSVKVIGIM